MPDEADISTEVDEVENHLDHYTVSANDNALILAVFYINK